MHHTVREAGRADTGNRTQFSLIQFPSFNKHLLYTCHVPGILLTAGETVLMKIDDVLAVVEVEVESENKRE